MTPPKPFFILRTMRYAPDDLIQLGQIITDRRKPYERLSPPKPFSGPLQPRTSTQEEWRASHTDHSRDSVRVFTKFVDVLRSEASAGRSVDEAFSWEAATLETQFLPLNEDRAGTDGDNKTTYVETAGKDPVVEAWLKRWYHELRSVYMVTGVMVARQPGKAAYKGAMDLKLSAGAEGEVAVQGGMSVKTGAEVNHHNAAGTRSTGQQQGDFVFAYELRRLVVFFSKLKVHDVVEGGDLYGVPPSGRGGGTHDYDDDEEEIDPSQLAIANVVYGADEHNGESLKGFEEIEMDDGALIYLVSNV